MNIKSTARNIIIASALVLATGIAAQAKSSALDVAAQATKMFPGKIHSVHAVKDNDNLLYEITLDGDDGATHAIRYNAADGKMVNHISRVNITHQLMNTQDLYGGGHSAAK